MWWISEECEFRQKQIMTKVTNERSELQNEVKKFHKNSKSFLKVSVNFLST